MLPSDSIIILRRQLLQQRLGKSQRLRRLCGNGLGLGHQAARLRPRSADCRDIVDCRHPPTNQETCNDTFDVLRQRSPFLETRFTV
jgi:hypothetical protein